MTTCGRLARFKHKRGFILLDQGRECFYTLIDKTTRCRAVLALIVGSKIDCSKYIKQNKIPGQMETFGVQVAAPVVAWQLTTWVPLGKCLLFVFGSVLCGSKQRRELILKTSRCSEIAHC